MEKINVPFLDNIAKARALVERINRAAKCDGYRPLVFSTLLKVDILEVIQQANCRVYDFFETFISSIEQELQQPSVRAAGRSHGL